MKKKLLLFFSVWIYPTVRFDVNGCFRVERVESLFFWMLLCSNRRKSIEFIFVSEWKCNETFESTYYRRWPDFHRRQSLQKVRNQRRGSSRWLRCKAEDVRLYQLNNFRTKQKRIPTRSAEFLRRVVSRRRFCNVSDKKLKRWAKQRRSNPWICRFVAFFCFSVEFISEKSVESIFSTFFFLRRPNDRWKTFWRSERFSFIDF